MNTLTDPLISIDQTGEPRIEASLPGVYEALMADRVDSFPALRPHQRHPWHAFLAQLGAMALHRAGLEQPPAAADEWRELLRGLTPEWPGDEPWHLVVDDITKPAFMQPPARSREREKDYTRIVSTPDELDMLVTAKNHDLKSSVIEKAKNDDWLFALVTLQTMEGYSGVQNYGISRMPSGYGNRPAFSITPSIRPGAHVKRDIVALLEQRQAILHDYQTSNNGLKLLWLEPWDGTKAEPLLINQLDPFYVEVCRRIRLQSLSGGLQAIRALSQARRINDAKGLTGDPWSPVSTIANRKGTPLSFLEGTQKFGYERVVDGLFSPDWVLPHLLKTSRYDQDSSGMMQLVARGMVRGDGGTQGYYERIIPLKPKVVQVFGRNSGSEELEDIARERIKDVGKVHSILHRAIATFAARGNSRNISKKQRKWATLWANRLDEIVDVRFFDALQTEFEADARKRAEIRKQWLNNGNDGVIDHARELLREATESLPCPTIYRFKALVQAEDVFWGGLRSSDGLPFVFAEPDKEEIKECPSTNQSQMNPNPVGTQMPLF